MRAVTKAEEEEEELDEATAANQRKHQVRKRLARMRRRISATPKKGRLTTIATSHLKSTVAKGERPLLR